MVFVRKLRDEDYMDVYNLIRPFYDEGHWSDGGEFSPENTMLYVTDALNQGAVFGAHIEDALVGVVTCQICYEFDTRPRCYVTDLYVLPAGRGTEAARLLVEAVVREAQAHNCVAAYSANTGNFTRRANALHDNLFKKYGFKPVSQNLMLEL